MVLINHVVNRFGRIFALADYAVIAGWQSDCGMFLMCHHTSRKKRDEQRPRQCIWLFIVVGDVTGFPPICGINCLQRMMVTGDFSVRQNDACRSDLLFSSGRNGCDLLNEHVALAVMMAVRYFHIVSSRKPDTLMFNFIGVMSGKHFS